MPHIFQELHSFQCILITIKEITSACGLQGRHESLAIYYLLLQKVNVFCDATLHAIGKLKQFKN